MHDFGLRIAAMTVLPLAMIIIGTSGAVAQAYGPDTCVQGYVWREAFDGDHVCVRPGARQRAADDNAQTLVRILENGYCIEGFVWREANPDDHVCVTPGTRAETRAQNEKGPRLRVNGAAQ